MRHLELYTFPNTLSNQSAGGFTRECKHKNEAWQNYNYASHKAFKCNFILKLESYLVSKKAKKKYEVTGKNVTRFYHFH